MNIVFFGLPATLANRDLLRRLAVAVRCENLPSAERRSLAEGSATLQEIAEAYPDCQAEIGVIAALDWQSPFLEGATRYLAGLEYLEDAEWSRLQSVIPFAPPGLRYARWKGEDARFATLAETNLPPLLPRLGDRYDGFSPLLDLAGMIPLHE